MKTTILIILWLLVVVAGETQVQAQQVQNVKIYCAGKKADGNPCHMTVTKQGDYCHFHNPNAPHCQAIKKDGTPCKMIVEEGEKYCHFHAK